MAWLAVFAPDAGAEFELKNEGVTDALSVVLVVQASKLGEAKRFEFDRIDGGELIAVPLGYGNVHGKREMFWEPAFTVHWVSPLGHASQNEVEESYIGPQVF